MTGSQRRRAQQVRDKLELPRAFEVGVPGQETEIVGHEQVAAFHQFERDFAFSNAGGTDDEHADAQPAAPAGGPAPARSRAHDALRAASRGDTLTSRPISARR